MAHDYKCFHCGNDEFVQLDMSRRRVRLSVGRAEYVSPHPTGRATRYFCGACGRMVRDADFEPVPATPDVPVSN